MQVLPPAVFYEVGRSTDEAVAAMVEVYTQRLLSAETTEPIAFRSQNGGDYNDVQVLKPGLASGVDGFGMHQREPALVSNTALGTAGTYTPRHFALTSRD